MLKSGNEMAKSGVYRTKSNMWVMVDCGGRGAENSWMPRTNSYGLAFLLQSEFQWSDDRAAQQKKLDAFAEEIGLEEVPLDLVRKTYPDWVYAG